MWRAENVILHYSAVPAQPWSALEAAWLPRLPDARQATVVRLREPVDRNGTLLGVALLAQACRMQGFPFDPRALEYSSRAKPRLPGGPDFSIGPAAGRVGCVLSGAGRVGFDLEAAGAVTAQSLRLVLTPDERRRLEAAALEPTAAWVMKEAVLKAAGLGIDAAAQVQLHARHATLGTNEYRLVPVPLGPDWVAWVAHETSAVAVTVVHHDLSDLLSPLP
jgi:phosphopantetheinyl transferase